ncbi:MAG: hypothetical protein Q7S84_03890 [bacterium]|nr:hypothetical protein [bacterium]
MKFPRFLAVALLSGTIIGAGMFSLPFVVRTLGLGTSALYLVAFAGVYVAIHRMYAALLETRVDSGQFVKLAEAYLPRRMAPTAGGIILLELVLVLTIYLILAPAFVELVLPGMGIVGAVVFWALGSVALFLKTSWLGWGEAIGVVAILAIVLAVLAVPAAPFTAPLAQPLSLGVFLLPFGPFLFAFAGRPAVGKAVELARAVRASGKPFPLGRVIAWGTALPAVIYLAFVVGVLRLAPAAGPDAVSSLVGAAPWLPVTLGTLGLVTLWTSYVIIGVNVEETLERDLRWKKALAATVAIAAPLALYVAGVREFFTAIGFAGGVFLSLEGIFIVMMWRRAFPHHPWRFASWLLVPIFLAAIAYEVAHLTGWV